MHPIVCSEGRREGLGDPLGQPARQLKGRTMGPSGSMATIPGRGGPDHGSRVGSIIGGFLNRPAVGRQPIDTTTQYMPPMAAGQFSRHMGRAVAVQPARPRHAVCSTLSLSVAVAAESPTRFAQFYSHAFLQR